MPEAGTLPDLLGRTSEVHGEEIWYRFAGGLTITTERLDKDDALRILPLGSPQGSLMNHMANFPEVVRGKRVFEPFAGAGALGFMALLLGAEHVDFLDINPRACDFQRQNADLNPFSRGRFRSIEGDIARFVPERTYDLVVASPPFVPTPDGIEGTITSNGGVDGNRFVEILFERLDELLEPSGEALVHLFQLESDGRPLVVDAIARTLARRQVALTPSQERPIPFETYRDAYLRVFPSAAPLVERWASDLVQERGRGLGLCHYVAHVGPQGDGATACVIRDDFAEKFGRSFLVPSDDKDRLALARVLENFLRARG